MLPNITEVLNSMKSLLLSAFTGILPDVKETVEGYIKDAEGRLKQLATGAISGELPYNYVIARLKEEPINIKNQFLSITQIVGADVQDLANQAVDIFEGALKNTIIQNEIQFSADAQIRED